MKEDPGMKQEAPDEEPEEELDKELADCLLTICIKVGGKP